MHKVLKSRRFWGTVGFFLLLVLIVTAGWLYGRYTHSKRLTAPSNSLTSLRNNVNQVYLVAVTLRDTDGTLDTAPATLVALQNSLQQSLDTAKDLHKKHQKSLSKETSQQLSDALQTQEQLLDEYTSRYQVLSKAISYNPSLDLEIADNAEVSRRALAAQTNLSKLASNRSAPLSDGSIDALTAVANCFGQVADVAKTNKSSQLNETRSRCIRNYAQVRSRLVESLQAQFKTNEANDTFALLKDTLTKL